VSDQRIFATEQNGSKAIFEKIEEKLVGNRFFSLAT